MPSLLSSLVEMNGSLSDLEVELASLPNVRCFTFSVLNLIHHYIVHSVSLALPHHHSPLLSCLAEIIMTAANVAISQYSPLSRSVVNTAAI